ncbi:HD domain-containing phosphohydrolase [Pseudorhodoferax sp. Leaf267]|uniref:response regulator n=1 Tax=Pseudorhodoferax sp. Leaf267 TaxID=1736316 RepID=UPI0006F3205A|nr:HD domain-containing phosphohydrolase [Pseudorhodoferax sp. Leaf267]KQP12305.1 two-component system response regulator [Pseudorhodoferax sp. Leaf267]
MQAARMPRPKFTVLVVDDVPENLSHISGLLQPLYHVKVAPGGARALEIVRGSAPPDLILLDIMMPGMDGYAVCGKLKSDPRTSDIPVIFLTAMAEDIDQEMGLGMGAADYISKPVNPAIVMARVAVQLDLKQARDRLHEQNRFLEQEVTRRTDEMNGVHEATALVLAGLATARDNDTGHQLVRLQHFVQALARRLSRQPRHAPALSTPVIDLLFRAAPMHDIGMLGIPDRILVKPTPLTQRETALLQTHPARGRAALEQVERRLGRTVPWLELAKEIAHAHEERWDGSGFPRGLAGVAIPLSARLVAVADVYNQMTQPRIGRVPCAHAEAVALIGAARDRLFDPDVVDAFLAIEDEFQEIARRYPDTEADFHKQLALRDAVGDTA